MKDRPTVPYSMAPPVVNTDCEPVCLIHQMKKQKVLRQMRKCSCLKSVWLPVHRWARQHAYAGRARGRAWLDCANTWPSCVKLSVANFLQKFAL